MTCPHCGRELPPDLLRAHAAKILRAAPGSGAGAGRHPKRGPVSRTTMYRRRKAASMPRPAPR